MRIALRDRRWNPDEQPKAMWDRLNDAWRDLRALADLLDKRLTFRTLDFTGPLASVKLTVSSDSRPVGVVLVSLYETTTNATSAVTFAWTWGDGGMTTTSFSALPSGTYRATFLVIGGA